MTKNKKVVTEINFDLDYKIIGKRIQTQRKKLKLSQQQLAAMVGLSTVHVSHVEGGTSRLSLESFVKMCLVLKIDYEKVLTGQVFKDKKRISNDIVKLLSGCSDQEVEMFAALLKTYIDKRDNKLTSQ